MSKFFQKLLENIEKLNSKVLSYEKVAKDVFLPSKAYMNWGISLATSGDIKTALEKFEASANMTLKSSETFLNWGIALAKNAQYKEAIEKFIKAIKLDPTLVKAHSLLSATYIEIGDIEQAEKSYKRAIQLEPKNSEIYINWGISQAKLSKRLQAEKCFEKAVECNPLSVQAMFLWGIVLAEQYKFDEAIEKFEKVVTLNPKNSEAYYYIALSYLKKKESFKAISNAKKSINLFPHKIDTYIILAEAYSEQSNFEECQNCYITAEKINPNHPILYISWASSLQKFNKYKESLEKLEKSPPSVQNSSSNLYFKSCALSALGKLQQSIEILKMLIKRDTEDYNIIEELGENYQKNKEFTKAISCYKVVLKHTRRCNHLYCSLAECFEMIHDRPAAIKNYEKFLEYFPNHALVYVRLANLQIELDNHKEALRRIRKAYQLRKKDDSYILFEYAKILLLVKDYENSLEKINQLIETNPDYELAYFCKADIFLHTKNYEKLKELLLNIENNFSESVKTLHFLGLTYVDIGDYYKDNEYYNQAIKYFNKAIEKGGETLAIKANLAYLEARFENKEGFIEGFKNIFKEYFDKKDVVEKYFKSAIEKLDFGQEFDNLVKEEIEKVIEK